MSNGDKARRDTLARPNGGNGGSYGLSQTLYKIDRQQHYGNLDPILTGTVKIHLVRQAWDEAIRLIASIHERIVSASLILHRLGSYARQNSIHQALAEIGRVHKTLHILKTLDDEEYRRRMWRELNKLNIESQEWYLSVLTNNVNAAHHFMTFRGFSRASHGVTCLNPLR